jgi:alkaline phosphatase
VVSVAPEDSNIAYKTVAELAKERGMKVGILTSVSLDHATPAVFYSHQPSRDMYFHIAQDAAISGTIDFIGGGSFRYVNGYTGSRARTWPDHAAGAPGVENLWSLFENNGFTVVHNLADLKNVPAGAKCVAASDGTQDSAAMHYEIDRSTTDEWNLADVTAEAIHLLDNPKGFFMMVEGGKIDWTNHANDARTSIEDVLAFDAAVQQAIAFANQHPTETLIVVTADHETGGMTMGWAGTPKANGVKAGYTSWYEKMFGQTMSYQAFSDWVKEYQADPYSLWNFIKVYLDVFGPADADIRQLDLADDDVVLAKIKEAFGLVYDDLCDFQKKQLEAAYDRSMMGAALVGSEEDWLLYGGYDALAVTCTHILNARAGIGWTSYSHTAIPVPVMSNGQAFTGYYDNTDIAKKIATFMGVTLD